MVGCNVLLSDKGGSTTPMQGADLSYGGASSCHGYYLYTLFCSPPKESAATWLSCARSVCMQYVSPESGLCFWSGCTVSWHVVPGTCPTGGYPARNSTIIYCTFCVCARARSYYATAGAHTLLWRMCSVTSGVGSSFSLLATLESEEATSTSWTQFWSLLIYVSLFFLVLNKCIKVRYNVWAFHSASELWNILTSLFRRLNFGS